MQTSNQNLENAILFDVKEEALIDLTLGEHITRLSRMRDQLSNAITSNRGNLDYLRQISRTQTAQLQTSYQILQTQTKGELQRMRKFFEPAMNGQRADLSDMKTQVSKITAEQLTTKKGVLNCEALIDHCQNEMGFIEIKAARKKQ